MADRLGEMPVFKIYSSPLLRAKQTAEILSHRFGVPFEIEDALREYDCGILEGKSDPASWALYSDVLDDWALRGNWDRRIEGGESFLDIKARFVPFIDRLLDAYGALDVNILLVAHGGIYHVMLPLVLENVTFENSLSRPLGNTAFALAQAREDRLHCLEWSGEMM